VKDFQDYVVGDEVNDSGFVIGRVEALEHHADRPMGYLLVVNDKHEYTIYMCLTHAKSGLSLTRNIPSYVMTQFADVIRDGPPVISPYVLRKYPVISQPQQQVKPQVESHEVEPVVVQEPAKESASSPYFDFI